MTLAPEPAAIAECAVVDVQTFHDQIRAANKPVVMRGLVSEWPSVAAGRDGDRAMIDYLKKCGTAKPVAAIAAPPSEKGRFFYTPDLAAFNFIKAQGHLAQFLDDLMIANELAETPAMAVQSEALPTLSPVFAAQNRLDLLPDVEARIWIGNRVRVGTHFDLTENVACVVAGRRRFTLFPPEQVANLYLGPLERTPAGTPTSLVDLQAPDLEKYPRFPLAWAEAQTATLEPGDALYIPYGWWHAVDSLEPLNILVNYWWNNPHEGLAAPYDALLHMIAAFRNLQPHQRAVWRSLGEYYAFSDNHPGDHLPESAKGMLGPYSPQLMGQMMSYLKASMR